MNTAITEFIETKVSTFPDRVKLFFQENDRNRARWLCVTPHDPIIEKTKQDFSRYYQDLEKLTVMAKLTCTEHLTKLFLEEGVEERFKDLVNSRDHLGFCGEVEKDALRSTYRCLPHIDFSKKK